MPTTLTAKLKLATTPDQFAALRATQLAYRDGLNQVSQYAFAHGKTSSRRRFQRDLYREVRSQCALPAQMACSVFRQVGATYQGLWTKARKNAEVLRKSYTKKRFRGLDKPPHYVSPTLSYVYGRDYSLRSSPPGQSADALWPDPCGLSGVPEACGPAAARSSPWGSKAVV